MNKLIIVFFFSVSILSAQNNQVIDNIFNSSISERIMPGAAVIIGSDTGIYYKNFYGHFTYDSSSPNVGPNSLFDLASLTKVFATTMCIMKLADEGLLNIDDYVGSYLPEFAVNGKEKVTVANLLLHNSGLQAYYTPSDGEGRNNILKAVMELPLSYNTGGKTVYSCLNFVTLMRLVEKIAGKPMHEFYQEEVTGPLNLRNTFFTPDKKNKLRCLPTLPDRQGEVHDPLAYGLEGLSGNAGLFSTADDLAVLCRLMLNKGTVNGIKIFSEKTVEKFTKVFSDKSSRALGWDTNITGGKSAGTMFSFDSYGHTGYTGTSAWCDPGNNIFIVILTNRVYPDDKTAVDGLRMKAADAAFMIFKKVPPQPKMISFERINSGKFKVEWDSRINLAPSDSTEIWGGINDELKKIEAFTPVISSAEIEFGENSTGKTFQVMVINKVGGNFGIPSNTFLRKGEKKELLIVNGIDKPSNKLKNYTKSTKKLAEALPGNLDFETCGTSEIISGKVKLNDYLFVFWEEGEDNYPEISINDDLREKVDEYLGNGGKMFISGSEIGWALGRHEGTPEINFYNNAFKAKFISDNSFTYSVYGEKNGIFDGLKFEFGKDGSIYTPGYPDVLTPLNEAETCLNYEDGRSAAILFTSNYKLLYCGFPIETVEPIDARKKILNKIVHFLLN